MSELSAAAARRHHVITAATNVFLRYGYTRTTMNDIAKAAGLTRPTLYQSYPDKEAVFRAVIDEMATQLFATIQEGLAKHQGLAEDWASPARPGERQGSRWSRRIQTPRICSISASNR